MRHWPNNIHPEKNRPTGAIIFWSGSSLYKLEIIWRRIKGHTNQPVLSQVGRCLGLLLVSTANPMGRIKGHANQPVLSQVGRCLGLLLVSSANPMGRIKGHANQPVLSQVSRCPGLFMGFAEETSNKPTTNLRKHRLISMAFNSSPYMCRAKRKSVFEDAQNA